MVIRAMAVAYGLKGKLQARKYDVTKSTGVCRLFYIEPYKTILFL
jgi:hypothetical protein